MKKFLRNFSISALLALVAVLTACGDASNGGSAQESWEHYLASRGETQKYYLEADYDGDGQVEAYAVTGTDFDYEGRTLNAKVYFISSTGKVTCVLDKAPDGGPLCGWLYNNLELSRDPNAAYTEEGNKKFIIWELDVRNGVHGSRILGVKNGMPYEPQISGKYIRFGQAVDGLCYGSKPDDNILYGFRFNDSTNEYELVKKKDSLTGQILWEK